MTRRERFWELVAAVVMFASGYVVCSRQPADGTWGHGLLFGVGMIVMLFALCLVADRGPR